MRYQVREYDRYSVGLGGWVPEYRIVDSAYAISDPDFLVAKDVRPDYAGIMVDALNAVHPEIEIGEKS